MENQLLVSQNRVFIAKAMWRTTAPTVIGSIEEVVKFALDSDYFKNGIEYIKELEGTKFVRVSKKDIEKLLSYSEEQTNLFKALSARY